MIPPPSPSVKIQIMSGKVCLRCKSKTLQGVVNKHFVFKNLLKTPGNVLSLNLNQTFPSIIWIFTIGKGDRIISRLPFKIISTLSLFLLGWKNKSFLFCSMVSSFSSSCDLLLEYVCMYLDFANLLNSVFCYALFSKDSSVTLVFKFERAELIGFIRFYP